MSEQTSQEPTMEEILASIRRIISEDDAPPAEEAAPAATEEPAALEAARAPEPEPEAAVEPEPVAAAAEPEPEPEPVAEEEALELTDKVETHGDLDVVAPAAAPPPPQREPAPMAAPAPVEGLVSEHAATAAASAFGQLSAAIAMPRSDRTLEDVVRELLRPLLQQWLDDNLPAIVQQSVEAEVARIARGRVR
jgi:cell pole-organizing protein PopZ